MASGSTNAPYGGAPIEVYLSQTKVDIVKNRSEWAWSAFYNNKLGAWGAYNYWELKGFATSGPNRFALKASDGSIKLGGGKFWKNHAADGTLAAGTLTLHISSENPWVGKGSVSVGSGTPPRVPRGPRVRHNGTWRHTVAYVKHNGTWKIAIPYVRHNGSWKVSGG